MGIFKEFIDSKESPQYIVVLKKEEK